MPAPGGHATTPAMRWSPAPERSIQEIRHPRNRGLSKRNRSRSTIKLAARTIALGEIRAQQRALGAIERGALRPKIMALWAAIKASA